jgi:hypothetical protein
VATAPASLAPYCGRGARFDYEEFAEQFKQQFGYAL